MTRVFDSTAALFDALVAAAHAFKDSPKETPEARQACDLIAARALVIHADVLTAIAITPAPLIPARIGPVITSTAELLHQLECAPEDLDWPATLALFEAHPVPRTF